MVRFPGVVLCVIVAVLAPSLVSAQLQQTQRYEKEFKYSEGVFSIIPLGEDGILLIRDRDKFDGGKKIWEAIHLDTDLKEKKTISLALDPRNRLMGYAKSPGQVLLLYRQGDTEKNNIELVEVNLSGDEHPRHVVKPELAMSFTHFTRVGNSAILGGYVNKEPSVLLYELGARSMKIIPGFFQKDSELVDLRVNVNNTFNVVLIERSQRDERRVVFQTYDEHGQLLLEDVVTLDDRRTLQTGLTSMLIREDLILLGTWGEGNAKQSNGFFALPIDPVQDQKVKYSAVGELNHYLDYMKESRARRIRENTQQVVSSGGIPNFINYVMPYRIQEYEEGFLLFAEAYSPSSSFSDFSRPYGPYYYSPYYSPYGWYYPGYGRLYSRPYSYGYRSRNEEIKTYQSMVISFAPDGTVQWDHSLQLDDVRRGGLEQVADFHYVNGHLIFLEKHESEIRARWILPQDGEDDETVTQKILLPNPEDEIRSEKENEGGIQYWYGNNFFVWGYHTIRNTTMKERVREVFYINKVEVN